jgi:uncharacterized protein
MTQYCPHCKKRLPEEIGSGPEKCTSLHPYFPFCSDRCKMADLYGWLDGQYRIPAVEQDSESGDNDPNIDGDLDSPEESQ